LVRQGGIQLGGHGYGPAVAHHGVGRREREDLSKREEEVTVRDREKKVEKQDGYGL
jgi:hypothetical protein